TGIVHDARVVVVANPGADHRHLDIDRVGGRRIESGLGIAARVPVRRRAGDGEAAISHRIAADSAGGGAVGADADQVPVTTVMAEASAETVAHEEAAEAAAHEATEPRPMVARTMAVTVAGATAKATVRSPFGVAEVA